MQLCVEERHERLGDPLAVLVRDRWQSKKDTHKGCLFCFEPLAGLEPAIYVSEPPIYIRNGVTLHTENQYSKLVIC